MKTYTLTENKIAGKAVLATGYKAIKYNGKTMQGDYSYGSENAEIVGTIHTVDGNISECRWGLHFSKDPAYVFNFYEPLGYNRYFKVEAYEECIDSKDGLKSVAKTLKFVEEYDIMEFIEQIKEFDRSSNAVSDSNAVSCSNAVRDSNAVSDSYAVYKSEAVKNCIFCHSIECAKYHIFNKEVTQERFNEIYRKVCAFGYFPKYDNFYDLKGNKEWWAVCFPELMVVDNATAWSKIQREMVEYLRGLPEFDEEIYKKITGNEG